MRVEFHPEAETEFIESALFYESRVTGLGVHFIQEVEHATRLLQEHPELGQLVEDRFRHLVLQRFPFTLIYAIESGRVWIMAVAHQHQRPGYWRERT